MKNKEANNRNIMIFFFLIIILIINVKDVFSATTGTYYSEKTVTSGTSLAIGKETYSLLIGNSGTRIKLEKLNFTTYVSLKGCKNINNTIFCHLENLSDSSAKVSMQQLYGELSYKISRSILGNTIQLLIGQPIEIRVNFTNIKNLTIESKYVDSLEGFDILEYENCILDGNKIIFNESIEPEDVKSIYYKITPNKKFKKTEFTPSLEYYNAIERKTVKMDKHYYESLDSYLLDVDISNQTIDIGKKFNITIKLNNTLKTSEINYSFDISIPEEYTLLTTNRMVKEKNNVRYKFSGNINNGSIKTTTIELFPKISGDHNISIEIELKNDKIDYIKKIYLKQNVTYVNKPKFIYRMKEYVLGEDLPQTLNVFMENSGDIKIKNITTKIKSKIKNDSITSYEPENVDLIAGFEFEKNHGKHEITLNITYYTEFEELVNHVEKQVILFPAEKKNPGENVNNITINTTININNTLDNVEKNNSEPKPIEDVETIKNTTIEDNKLIIIIAATIIVLVISLLIIIKLNIFGNTEEKLIVSEIEKIKKEIEEKEKNV